MQGIMETIFDVVYLSTVTFLGIRMILAGKKMSRKELLLFGIMAVVLGAGDSFHLVPRAYALNTGGLANHAVALGIGKLITSVTMTIFYVILYHIWRIRYDIHQRITLTYTIYGLAALRIILCMFPQNQWTSVAPPVSWGIIRNIPFAIMGLIIIYLFYTEAKKHQDHAFKYMWLAVTLSFGFYVPVVLWADIYPLVGILMIPKTIAYVWVVLMGYSQIKNSTVKIQFKAA